MSVDPSNIEVIYAEDEETFRLIAMPALLGVGIKSENIHCAENGQEAIDHLTRIQGGPPKPLLVLLDVRMPVMDGNECAAEIQKLIDGGSISRIPYVTICTAGADKVTTEGGAGVRLSLPKPLDKKQLQIVLENAAGWWAENGVGAGASFDIKDLQVVVANDEPICSMAVVAALTGVGVEDDLLIQADSVEDMVTSLTPCTSNGKPIVIMVGNAAWVPDVLSAVGGFKPKPYVVCTSPDKPDGSCNAWLPKTDDQGELNKVLQEGLSFWTRQ